ncbi:MAG: non-heme iron oxygenase ferredoxin subunit [Marinobacter sp.]|uniref:non-heme iron oxygenase ferredoxin subunit n=1 Tax=Marinobacter sp. TaxID=50741 RepID=UPI0034A071A6
MADNPTPTRLCSTDDVDPGSALLVEIDDLELAVYNVDGHFYVTDDRCTHGPGSLSEGYLDGCVIECDFHNGAFDIRTGEVVAPPCMVPLKTYEVVVENNDVMAML